MVVFDPLLGTAELQEIEESGDLAATPRGPCEVHSRRYIVESPEWGLYRAFYVGGGMLGV